MIIITNYINFYINILINYMDTVSGTLKFNKNREKDLKLLWTILLLLYG